MSSGAKHLSKADKDGIVELADAGASYGAIAGRYRISEARVSEIVRSVLLTRIKDAAIVTEPVVVTHKERLERHDVKGDWYSKAHPSWKEFVWRVSELRRDIDKEAEAE